ncbi:MAG: Glutaredoxin [Gammaproteobacteria bacterium]|nr:Glutaredoxin [Gammaproteobacteria bacterium]
MSLATAGGKPGAAAAQPRLTVVHRQDCDLCDEMVAELEALGRRIRLPPIDIVDVDADPELVRRYGPNVPVLLLDGTVVCRHRLDADELQRLLRMT